MNYPNTKDVWVVHKNKNSTWGCKPVDVRSKSYKTTLRKQKL